MAARDRTEGKASAERLVRAFADGIGTFKHSSYDEARVRRGFIDPFFEALGWEVEESAQRVGGERDVILEDRDGKGRRPDYGFYCGSRLKFCLEAKKPSVSIANDKDAVYQAKSYAWHLRIPLALLTDFEEFRGYFVDRPPNRDKPRAGELQPLSISYTEYVDRWDFLWDTLSREAVHGGSIERFVRSAVGGRGDLLAGRGSVPVDAAFLKDLDGWREALARELALRNDFSSSAALTEAVQRILDRIVFLRVCEARGIARGEPMRKALETWRRARRASLYRYLVDVFREVEPRFNGGLFTRHPSESVQVERDDVLEQILEGLYEQGPYKFDLLPVEILGSIYERYLGSTIRLTESGHRAKVELKPEVRHAGGVYYTPAAVVQTIVRKTLGPLTQGKRPRELLNVRVLDPACGSGSFLLAAYDHLMNEHLNWYRQDGRRRPPAEVLEYHGELRLTLKRKKDILASCIFGLDKDPQAVQVAQMSLYMKLLEGEGEETLARRETVEMFAADKYLPPLDRNLRSGNALVTSQDLDPQQSLGADENEVDKLLSINPFDWSSISEGFAEVMDAGGFDAVIGNPPYIRIQELQKWAPAEVSVFRRKFRAAKKGSFDIYVLFIEQALNVLSSTGRVGLIVPSKFLSTDYGAATRSRLSQEQIVDELVDFGHEQVFEGVSTYTCLLFLDRRAPRTARVLRVRPTDLPQAAEAEGEPLPAAALALPVWVIAGESDRNLLDKVARAGSPLAGFVSSFARGSSTGADRVFVLDRAGRELRTHDGSKVSVEPGVLRTPLYASDFSRYEFRPSRASALIFPYEKSERGFRLLSEAKFRSSYPECYEYLRSKKRELEGRAGGDTWYSFSAPRSLAAHEGADWLVPLLADRGLCAPTHGQIANNYCVMAGAGFSVTLSGSHLSPWYLLALVNSRLLFFALKHTSNKFRGGWVTCTKQFFTRLPICKLDLSDSAQRAEHDAIARLAERIVNLRGRGASTGAEQEQIIVSRQVDAAEREIDDRVYRLYGLTQEERRQVEVDQPSGRLRSPPAHSSDNDE